MAFIFNNSVNPNGIPVETGHEVVWHLKDILVRAGWVVTQSGDGGSNYDIAGDVLMTPGVLPMSAWFEIQNPNGQAFTFHRVSNNIRVKYASIGGFRGGGGSATQTPAASFAEEEQIVMGGGTDSSPQGASFGAVAAAVLYLCADNEAPFGFYSFSKRSSSPQTHSFFFFDPLLQGSYTDTDGDPVVIGWASSSANFAGTAPTSGTAPGARAWFRKSWPEAAFQGVGSMNATGWGASGAIFPKSAGPDPESGDDITMPVIWGRALGLPYPHGWKGVSSLFRAVSTSRMSGETQDSKQRILIVDGDWSAPWNGTTPLI